jgi:2-phosphosulfolactate phosphatase
MRYYVGVEGRREFLQINGGMPVIIDVLRATSTIVTALWAGAERVVPVVDAGEALQLGKKLGAVLVGERNGVRLDGFDYNNSPGEMLGADIKGRTIVITTTNGTRIMTEGGLIASTLNAGVVAEAIRSREHSFLLASSPDRSVEDLCAASLIERMAEMPDAIIQARSNPEFLALLDGIRHSHAGEKVARLGYVKDVEMICTEVNRFPILPVYKNGAITANTKS